MKCFPDLSKDEQREGLRKRLEHANQKRKFSADDIKERQRLSHPRIVDEAAALLMQFRELEAEPVEIAR